MRLGNLMRIDVCDARGGKGISRTFTCKMGNVMLAIVKGAGSGNTIDGQDLVQMRGEEEHKDTTLVLGLKVSRSPKAV